MSYRKHRSDHTIIPHLAAGSNHGLRYLTADDSDPLTAEVPILYDAFGNCIISDKTGNSTNFVTADASTKVAGNYPKWVSDGGTGFLLGAGDTGGGGGSVFRVRDGLNVEYDPAPSSASAQDDEFNASSLNGKWTVVTNTAASVDYHTTWESHAYIVFTGNQDYEITQSYSPGGDFSITALFRTAHQANFQLVRIQAQNSGSTEGILYDYIFGAPTGGQQNTRIQSVDSGSQTTRANLAGATTTTIYLHLKVASNVWSAYYSLDGLAWFRTGTHSKTFTVAKVGLRLNQTGATVPSLRGVDWFRRDWISL